MNELYIILGVQISVGVVEIIVFLAGAVVLGFFIHFFLVSRKAMPFSVAEPPVLAESSIQDNDEWRLKYYEEMELQEQMRRDLEEAQSNEELLDIEIEELKKEIRLLQQQQDTVQTVQQQPSVIQPEDYLDRLKSAQNSLLLHNQQISLLLEQVNMLKESEQKYLSSQQANEALQEALRTLQQQLADKEEELKQAHRQQQLMHELQRRLEKTYDEFNVLREKLQKVEATLAHPQNRRFEYEELQQNYFKLTKEFDEQKLKQLSLLEENQRLSRLLADTEDKLRESNFQRQQQQKKITYLEELNHDLQQISEQNKKLENQLKRMSEIEMLLARVSEKKQEDMDEQHPPE